MDLLPKLFQGNSMKSYLRRRRYKRLVKNEIASGKKLKITRLGGGGGSPPRRVWRIKASPKLRCKFASPSKLFKKLKNAYMDMMLNLARNVGYLKDENVLESKRIPKARQSVPVVYSLEEVEDRLVFEIYKALKASVHEQASV